MNQWEGFVVLNLYEALDEHDSDSSLEEAATNNSSQCSLVVLMVSCQVTFSNPDPKIRKQEISSYHNGLHRTV